MNTHRLRDRMPLGVVSLGAAVVLIAVVLFLVLGPPPHAHLGRFADPAVDFKRWSRAHHLDNLTDAAPAACTTGDE